MRSLCAVLALVASTLAVTAAPVRAAGEPYGVVVREGVIHDRFGNDLKAYYSMPAKDGRVAPGRFPAILAMNYTGLLSGENLRDLAPMGDAADGAFFARHGYVFAGVDFPGRGASSSADTLDPDGLGYSGYDAVEWLAGSKPDGSPSPDAAWSTGKVGMSGMSGNGMVQLWVAQRHPPHLRTIVPEVAPWDLYRFLFYPGGIRSLSEFAFIAATYTGTDEPCQDVPGTAQELAYDLACLKRKLGDLDLVSLDALDWLHHPNLDAYWQPKVVDLSKITVPIWSLGSWDDFFTGSETDLYERTASKRKLLAMGIGGHTIRSSIDYYAEVLPWYDRWLKGVHNAIDSQLRTARFRYYVQRENRWRMARRWPIPGTRYTPLYLAGRIAGTPSVVTGALTHAAGPPGQASYLYVPGQGWTSGQYGTLRPTHITSPVDLLDPLAPMDQRLEAADTAQFLSAPLDDDTEVTGPVRLTFYAASSATDTDWIVHLLDGFPSGYRYKVTTGWLSGTHRDSLAVPEPIPPGRVVRYEVALYPTSYLFRKGHRIGVAIASGGGVHTVPNLNVAVNTISFGTGHPSAITVPIVPPGASSPDSFRR